MSKVTVDARAFQAALARVTSSIKPQKTYPILQCVRISAGDGEMQIAGTDLDVAISVTLPASGEMAAICRVSCNTRKLQVEVEGATYLTKLIEGVFPDWRRVTPTIESALSFDRATLVAAARIAAAAKSNAKGGKSVKLSFAEDETRLEAVDHDNPQFSGSDVVRHSQLSKPLSDMVGLNIDYLLEIVAELDAETIEMAPPEGSSGPIVLRGAAHDDRIAVIMSMRV